MSPTLVQSFLGEIERTRSLACFDTAENKPCKVCPLSAYRSPRYFYRPPKDSYANPEEPVIHSYLDDPDPKWSTLRKASSTSRINLKYGSQNKDPYETTHRVELYGKDHTIRRAPSLPTVPIARIDYVTDPKRFSHDADAGWRRMNLRRAP